LTFSAKKKEINTEQLARIRLSSTSAQVRFYNTAVYFLICCSKLMCDQNAKER